MVNEKSFFYFYKDKVEDEITKGIVDFGEKTKLRDACEYALKSGGKRFRPLLVLLVAEALNHQLNVMDAAIAVEFFHTASLIVDDLPCMDNEKERRSRPTLHKIYGESIALLASYALVCAAFEKIQANTITMRGAPSPFGERADATGILSLGYLSRYAGIAGATGGQFYDLFPPTLTLGALKEVIYKKTVMLFEASFVLGWLFGGGEEEGLEKIRKGACHFGMAFQIADDLKDITQDEDNKRGVNLAKFLGKEKATTLFKEELNKFRKILTALGIETVSFKRLAAKLYWSVADSNR